MLGQDGKPVIGPDGKIVMLNADGTRVKREEEIKAAKKKGKEDPNAKKKAFMKKTRQVHMIPDEVRAFRKEHRKDWLLEDNGGGLAASQSWSGKYSDVNDKHIWAFFAPVPGNDKEFRFIPVHRFYNFTRNNNVNAERVESQHARMQAAKSNTKAKPKKEEEEEKPMRGGRRLKVTNHGNTAYGDDESKPHLGGEGDYDEVEYEDEVQDDEEVPPDAPQDEEEKEAAERQKREYLRGKVSERIEPESDEDEDDAKGYTEDGRQLKKLMKKMLAEGESDDEKNPYADSDDEEDEDEKPEQPPAIGVMPNTPTPAQSGTSTPRPQQGSQPSQPQSQAQKLAQTLAAPNNASRSGSPSMGGAALLAQRATSPHPNRKSPSVGSGGPNRATTPLSSAAATPGSSGTNGKKRKDRPSDRGGTPTPPQKRPTPTPQTPPQARAGTPNASVNGQKKKKSKHDLVAPNGDSLPEVITEEHAIEYLRKMGGAVQTSECITYFKRALKHDPENQKRLTDALKKVSTQAQKGYIKLNAPWAP